MSDEKFTKGVWIANRPIHSNGFWHINEGVDEDYQHNIATAWIGDDNAEANAHLIAAAPEMYKALKEIVDGHKKDVGGGFLCSHELIDAESALAKARGES